MNYGTLNYGTVGTVSADHFVEVSGSGNGSVDVAVHRRPWGPEDAAETVPAALLAMTPAEARRLATILVAAADAAEQVPF